MTNGRWEQVRDFMSFRFLLEQLYSHRVPVSRSEFLLCLSLGCLFQALFHTLIRTSSLCSQSLWFWKRFSSFQMFSSRSSWVDASPRVCWSKRERSDMRVTFSIRTSSRREDTWERETGESRRGREICSECWFTDSSAAAKVPKSSIIYYQSVPETSQSLNAEQMLNQSPAGTVTSTLAKCTVLLNQNLNALFLVQNQFPESVFCSVEPYYGNSVFTLADVKIGLCIVLSSRVLAQIAFLKIWCVHSQWKNVTEWILPV